MVDDVDIAVVVGLGTWPVGIVNVFGVGVGGVVIVCVVVTVNGVALECDLADDVVGGRCRCGRC